MVLLGERLSQTSILGAALIIWTGVGRGLGPLRKVAGEIAQRSPSQLQPLAVREWKNGFR